MCFFNLLDVEMTWFIVATFFMMVLMYLFLKTWLADPHFLKKSNEISFLTLVEKFDPNMLCPTCEVVCTEDS